MQDNPSHETQPENETLAAWRGQLRTLQHAYRDRPPTQYVVDKFFTTHSLNIVYGAPATMKSMLMADLCACIASGTDWLPGSVGKGGKGIAVQQGAALWIDLDNGQNRTDQRFDAIGTSRELPTDAPLYYLSMPMPSLRLVNEDSITAVIDLGLELQAKIIVIDNLGLITGDVEENSASMANIMGYLRIVAEVTGAAVIVIHHQRKGSANGGRPGDALRGHSSIEAAIDLALHILREDTKPEIYMRSTKTRGVDVPPMTARFHFQHKPETNDLQTAYFEGVYRVRGDNPVRDAILDVLEQQGQSTKGLLADRVYEMLNGEHGINKIRNWIGELIAVEGLIVETKGEKNTAILTLKEGQNGP